MPKPQIPYTIAEATGAAEHNPGRFKDRKAAPQPTGELGDPPNHFDDVDRDLWWEVAGMTAPGVLTNADRILVEITVGLLRRLRGIRRSGEDEVITLTPVELGHLRACLGSMGLTPADRGRVTGSNAKGKKSQDPLDVILGARGTGKAN